MRLLSLSVLFMLCLAQAVAQKKELIVNLTPILPDLPERKFFIDSVIDVRMVKDNIGMAQVGMSNRQVEARFDQSLEITLQQYFSKVAPARKEQQPIIALVNQLRVSEKTYAMKERGLAEVEITFCRVDTSGFINLGSFETAEESGGMDVSSGHAKRLTTALNTCLQKFNSSGWEKITGEAYVPQAEWQPVDDEHNILRAKVRQAGVYKNFVQLRSNTPMQQEVTVKPKGDLFLVREATEEKKLTEPYGFCDGKQLYINTFFYNVSNGKGMYARVVEEGRYLAWYDHYVGPTEMGLMGAGFGAIGMAAAKSGLDCIVLDLKTGVITPLNFRKLKQLLESEPELLEKYLQTKNAEEPSVMLAFIKSLNANNPL